MQQMTIGQLDPPTAKAKANTTAKAMMKAAAVDIGDPTMTTIVVQT